MRATGRDSVMWATTADNMLDTLIEPILAVPEDPAPHPDKTNQSRQTTSKKEEVPSAVVTKKGVPRSSTTMSAPKDKASKVTTAFPRKTRDAAPTSVMRAVVDDIKGDIAAERLPIALKDHIPRSEQTNRGRKIASKKEVQSAVLTRKGVLRSTAAMPSLKDQVYKVWGVTAPSPRKMRAAAGASVTRAGVAIIKGDIPMEHLPACLEDPTSCLGQTNQGKQTSSKEKAVRSTVFTKRGVLRSSATMPTTKNKSSKLWGVASRSSRKMRAAARTRVMRAAAADIMREHQNMRKVGNSRPTQGHSRPGSGLANEEQSAPKAALPSREIPRGQPKMVQQVSTSMSNLRRSFLPAPRATTPTEKSASPSPGSPRRSSPISGSKKIPKDIDPKPVSPKRTSVTSNFSPGHPKSRPNVGRNGFNTRLEADRQLVQRLKEKCEEQSRQLLYVQEELKRASLGFEVFAVATQHFSNKSESGQKKEKELYLELANIRDEVAINTAKCEKLQKEKEELERNFEDEVKKLQDQQVAELHTLEERLLLQYQTEMECLKSDHTVEIANLKSRHQQQVEDMTVTHEATVQGLETHHTEAIDVMQDEHMYQVEEMKCNHELEKKTLEDNFENLRLSLQDQVDTLTFQSHSLRDRAKRFEEALRKSTDEQFQVAFAPFQHLEEDLSSLKQVLEMKNQQIHEQEKRIMELEKLVDINVRLEERIQVLQQQNEDLKVRIDQNVAVTRHLSEENANLHESVEKESEEKKRLSRTNEELIWKLQTGEPMSPVRLSPSSALYHSVSGSLSPSKVHAAPR